MPEGLTDHVCYWAVFIDESGRWSLRCLSCKEHWAGKEDKITYRRE